MVHLLSPSWQNHSIMLLLCVCVCREVIATLPSSASIGLNEQAVEHKLAVCEKVLEAILLSFQLFLRGIKTTTVCQDR